MSIYTGWLVYTIGNLSNMLQLYKSSFLINYDLYVKYDTYCNTMKWPETLGGMQVNWKNLTMQFQLGTC